jgi:hypothetical protein
VTCAQVADVPACTELRGARFSGVHASVQVRPRRL